MTLSPPPGLHVRPLPGSDWPALAAAFDDGTFEQTRTYGSAAAARIGGKLHCLAVEGAEGPLAAAAGRLRLVPGLGRGILWLPSGPLICPSAAPPPDDATLAAILRGLRLHVCGQKGHVLRLRLSGTAIPDPQHLRAVMATAGFRPHAARPPYRSVALDLRQTPETLLHRMSGKWRTDLRAAEKAGLELERGSGPALAARFLALFGQVQATKGFRPEITPEFHFRLAEAAGPAADYRVETLIARHAGRDVAGIVVGTAGRTATYLFGATGPEGRPRRAGYFLTWQAVLQARAEGLHWYDLGGVDAAANPDVARFKERMGGAPICAEVFEARPAAPWATLILGLERLRARLRGKG